MLKKIIIGIVAITLILGIGIFVGMKISQKKFEKLLTSPEYLSAISNSVQKAPAGAANASNQKSSALVLGAIQQVSANSIILQTSEKTDGNKTVQITKDTKFYQLTANPNDRKVIAMSDIKVGQIVEVMASEDISSKKEFTAVSVSVMPTK